MNQEQYETILSEVNWESNPCYDHVKLRLMRSYTLQEMNDFSTIFNKHLTSLLNAIHRYENQNGRLDICSDDGFHDVTCHIVGLGMEELQRNIEDPKRVEYRFNLGDYRENFLYCIADNSYDYKLMSQQYYTDSVAEIRQDLGEIDTLAKQDVIDIIEEIEEGYFSDYDYDKLAELSEEAGISKYHLSNVWSDGRKFYETP